MSEASHYSELYQNWKNDPEGFWDGVGKTLEWHKPYDKVFDADAGLYGRWFTGGEINTCYNAVDRHCDGSRGNQTALIYDSPVTNTKKSYTYDELKSEVQALAAAMRELGVGKGDRVLIYMPMVPEALFSMLATARLGAIHTVVFGGFAANELATRIDDCTPKLIIAGSCGIEPTRIVEYMPMVDKGIEIADHKPENVIVLQRDKAPAVLKEGRDHTYASVVGKHRDAGTVVECVPVLATDPVYILYTSGTTGKPKGVVRDNGGHAAAMVWTMSAIYDVKPGEVYWAASDVGWVVGHSYIVYAPLLYGATTILFEGKPVGTPDASTFWRVMEEYKVSCFFTAPTAFRAVKKEDPEGTLATQFDLSHLRTIFLAGERADPDTVRWLQNITGKPVIDHWWQTETAWAIAANPIGLGTLPIKVGSPTVAMPGFDICVLDDDGNPVQAGTLGNIAIKLPLPPSCLPTLWNADQRFKEAYLTTFPGYYNTSDAGYLDEDGYVFIMARTDDIINVAGHRLSTGAMEEAIGNHPDVAECAVIGIDDDMKGQIPVGFLILNTGINRENAVIKKEVIAQVRNDIGPVAAFKTAVIVSRLPKTRSGKILRKTMQSIANGVEFTTPSTIDDPAIIDEIIASLQDEKVGVFAN